MIFLAQNLLLLRKGGELGIIIPDGLLTNSEFRVFRQDLLSNHGIVSVIQLPESIFKGTEARTHILILKKGVPNNRKVDLFLADKMGKFVDKVTVNQTLLLDRMDFYFHKHSQDYKIRKRSVTLGDLMVDIKRGQLTHSQLKNEQFYIHTTTLKHLKEIRLRSNKNSFNKNYVQTAKGDILLARVGRGCIGKVSLVNRGIQPISDCVYRIRVPREYVRDVWKSLTSEEGQKWLRARAHGVCAKVLSKQDLTKLPIIISSENNKNK
jgi:type I restriction enzyme M protein